MEARLEEGLRRVADGVTLISSVLYQRCLGLGVPADRMRVIPSGADVVGIVPGDMTIARERVGIPSDAKVVGFVGFVDVDVDLVLTAVARIAPRWPQVKVLIVGEIEFARTTAIRLGIEDKVILAGIQPYVALPDYFAACDVLAMPLRDTLFNRARWPNKTGDYLAAGRPIVSNPVGDVRSIFERHPVGLLAAPDDPTAFGTQLERLFADPALATRLGLEARRLAEGELSWERLTDDLVDFYLTTLDRKRIRGRRYPRGREQ
jgi:glycosyltransferase involved in cell wall biosynthesis